MGGGQTAGSLRGQGWGGGVRRVGGGGAEGGGRGPLAHAGGRGGEVTATKAADREVTTGAGGVSYGRLVIASGAEPVTLPGGGGYTLRTLDDAAALRPVLDEKRDVVVVGAGWIGAEFATAARQ